MIYLYFPNIKSVFTVFSKNINILRFSTFAFLFNKKQDQNFTFHKRSVLFVRFYIRSANHVLEKSALYISKPTKKVTQLTFWRLPACAAKGSFPHWQHFVTAGKLMLEFLGVLF